MSMLLPDALSPAWRVVGLTVSVGLMLWGAGAALWHFWGEGCLTWGSGLFGSPPMPFNKVRDLAAKRGIVFERFGAGQNMGANVEGALKAAAATGRLKVWGRPYQGPVRDHDPMLPIPSEHFREYSFRHGALDYEVRNDQTHTTTMAMVVKGLQGIEGTTFYDLHVSERQVRAALARFVRERRA